VSYITPAQLITGPNALLELAQLVEIDADLLAATIAAGDRSAWSSEEIAAADAALVTIADYITRADGEINARLSQRGYTLPMSPVQFPILVVWAAAIARYHLARTRDLTNEQTGRHERDYREAIKALQLVADGRLSLGAGDPLSAAEQTDATQITSNPRLFSRNSLAGL
jgi:phage gp36-like protein